ncbi:class D sortase [Rossellomorea sp. YZS02]|uniref:class D sortase n=1 Tax=Rossellomorea sp. YZS02 TaxID=3097358 RepID=UPI002A13D538|nr:class D sortase [Rossellomorea sp. YZS02]MDX8344101.1 class D sortase [Rossellomorea sp. YZS02]
MIKSYFFVGGMLILIAGLTCVFYSLYQINSHAREESRAMDIAKTSILQPPPERIHPVSTTSEVPIEYNFKKGDVIGLLSIPRLEREVPIIEGTDGKELKKGVGHYSSTSLPQEKDQIFLAGHRDTVFRNIGDLKSGDLLSIKMHSGTYSYEIFNSFIVDEHDTTVIRHTSPQEILTLSTCYPFNIYGSSSERYIIEAKRIY